VLVTAPRCGCLSIGTIRAADEAAPEESEMQHHPTGKWFDDLVVGEVIPHARTRTITEADNVAFTTMTMNPAWLHLDAAYAATTEFGRPLVNSLLTMSLVVGLSVHELTLGTTVANLGFGRIDFGRPVFHGDTIWAETEVISVRASSSRPTQGIAEFEHRGFNQDDEQVADIRRSALMLRRPLP